LLQTGEPPTVFRDAIENTQRVERFLYNELTGIPYSFDAAINSNGESIDVTDQVICTSSNEGIVKSTNSNKIFAVNPGTAKVTVSFENVKETYDVKVIDPIPVDYKVSTNNILLTSKGMTKNIEFFAIFIDGTQKKINQAVAWKSLNTVIASVIDNGLVCAESKGKTSVIASFSGKSIPINVTVLDSNYNKEAQAFLDKMKTKQLSNNITPMSLTQAERQTILDRCSYMYNTSWTPAQDLSGWKDGYTFHAGTAYSGIPYSQHGFTDRDGTLVTGLTGFDTHGFMYELAHYTTNSFYTSYNNGSFNMPRYGIDCSGYVSVAFNINRHTTLGFKNDIINGVFPKVGSYNASSPAYSDLMASYPSMQMGDALVYRDSSSGHTFIVGNNYATSCLCYEQTTYYTKLLWHDYTQLATDKYMPFSKK
jgi:hypothetical protein